MHAESLLDFRRDDRLVRIARDLEEVAVFDGKARALFSDENVEDNPDNMTRFSLVKLE